MKEKELANSVAKYLSGESRELENIFRLSCQDMYIYAKFLVGDDDMAYQLMKDTYLEVITHIHSLSEPEGFMLLCKKTMYRRAFVLKPHLRYEKWLIPKRKVEYEESPSGCFLELSLLTVAMDLLAQQDKYKLEPIQAESIYVSVLSQLTKTGGVSHNYEGD